MRPDTHLEFLVFNIVDFFCNKFLLGSWYITYQIYTSETKPFILFILWMSKVWFWYIFGFSNIVLSVHVYIWVHTHPHTTDTCLFCVMLEDFWNLRLFTPCDLCKGLVSQGGQSCHLGSQWPEHSSQQASLSWRGILTNTAPPIYSGHCLGRKSWKCTLEVRIQSWGISRGKTSSHGKLILRVFSSRFKSEQAAPQDSFCRGLPSIACCPGFCLFHFSLRLPKALRSPHHAAFCWLLCSRPHPLVALASPFFTACFSCSCPDLKTWLFHLSLSLISGPCVPCS